MIFRLLKNERNANRSSLGRKISSQQAGRSDFAHWNYFHDQKIYRFVNFSAKNSQNYKFQIISSCLICYFTGRPELEKPAQFWQSRKSSTAQRIWRKWFWNWTLLIREESTSLEMKLWISLRRIRFIAKASKVWLILKNSAKKN